MEKLKHYFQTLTESIPFGRWLFYILCIEVVSFAGFNFSIINTVSFFFLLALAFLVSMKKLQYGLLIVFLELIIGSKGYLFSYQLGDISISIRLGLFVIIFLAYLIWIIRDKQIHFFSWSLWKPYTLFIFFIAFAVFVGVIRGNDVGTLFLDANGYLYFGLIGPLTQAVRSRTEAQQFFGVLILGTVALIGKTTTLLFLWSQMAILPYTLPGIYRWVRETGIGEITRFDSGFSRIFIQSQIYAVFTFFFLVPWFAFITKVQKIDWKNRYFIGAYIVTALSLLVIFLSYSRSFWVGTLSGLIVLFFWLLIKERIRLRTLILAAAMLLCTAVLDYGVVMGIVNFPIPGSTGASAGSVLAERTKNLSDEPAAATRWQALDPLIDASLEHLFLGSGLGRTVTYTSEDPRVIANNPDGMYTTYAFEWGYLDLILKFGLFGFGAYIYLLYRLFKSGLAVTRQRMSDHIETIGIMAATVALLATHMFTPYLNHPLGIGWLLVVSVAVTILRRENQKSKKHA